MKLSLTHHSKNPSELNNKSSVEFQLKNNEIRLLYSLKNPDGNLLIPKKAKPAQRDNLWQHTCCEAFIGIINQPHYLEFNFSPSGAWAGYAFSDYREHIDWQDPKPPEIRTTPAGTELQLETTILLSALPDAFQHRPLELGLSVVLEDREQRLAYLALAHSQENPDFHRRDGWISLT